jgi:hypothetical protein
MKFFFQYVAPVLAIRADEYALGGRAAAFF